MTIAALYVQPRGIYAGFPGVDLWDEERDARTYPGPHPVVAHPPCARWCQLAGLVEAVHGHKRGDDGGTFAAALASVRRWGGVLEHPAWTKAWPAYGLPEPPKFGWQQSFDGSWVCEVAQVAYGHECQKLTWLYYVGQHPPEPAIWRRPKHKRVISGCKNHGSEGANRLWTNKASDTPRAFAKFLVGLARQSQVRRAA